jgi:hypothetical protein
MTKNKSSVALVVALSLACAVQGLLAVPPLVSDDVPMADKESFEFYTGITYENRSTVAFPRWNSFTGSPINWR